MCVRTTRPTDKINPKPLRPHACLPQEGELADQETHIMTCPASVVNIVLDFRPLFRVRSVSGCSLASEDTTRMKKKREMPRLAVCESVLLG